MTSSAKSLYAGYRFPGEIISHAVWLDSRFPLSLGMVEEMLAARGIDVSHETVRQWGASSARTLPTRSGVGCPFPAVQGSFELVFSSGGLGHPVGCFGPELVGLCQTRSAS